MTPLLPSDLQLDELREMAGHLIAEALRLPAQGLPQLRKLLGEALRPMNSYYTNKIEGQHTAPLLIEQALKADFSQQPDEARRQRIALAHIETERWGEALFTQFDAKTMFSTQFVQDIHRHLHQQLTEEDRLQRAELGSGLQDEVVVPGEYRLQGVKVGLHVPPDPTNVPDFMQAWHVGYQHQRAGESAIIALMASHHRLAWIHPFVDGNGRTARLHTHLGLSASGLTQGLWSPMRGLARKQDDYYRHLIAADQARKGDLDGRGILTEKGLIEFIRFMLDTCLDQVAFMRGMLQLDQFEARLAQMLAAESTKEATRHLKVDAAMPLAYLGTVPSMDRARFKALMGLADRTADRVLADLFKLGIVSSKTPKGLIELALPVHLFRYLFPKLWPEAEVSNTS